MDKETNFVYALLEFIKENLPTINDDKIKDLIDEVVDDVYLKKCDLSDSIDDIMSDNTYVTSDELYDKFDDYLYDNNYIHDGNIDNFITGYLSDADVVDKDDVENMIEIKLDEKMNELEMKLALIEIESEFLNLKRAIMKGE